MLRTVFAFMAALAAPLLTAQNAPILSGRIDGDTYYSPTGAFHVKIPVLQQLGATVTDTPYVVTFQDGFSTHISIAAFAEDATQRWQLSTLGPKDYLKYFFENFVLADFQRAFKNVQVETTARFLPGLNGGSFVTFVLIPGGSMFAGRISATSLLDKPRVAKRGNMIFVHEGFIYVISTELAERVTEGSAYNKTPQEEDNLLRDRLIDIAGTIQFSRAPASAPLAGK